MKSMELSDKSGVVPNVETLSPSQVGGRSEISARIYVEDGLYEVWIGPIGDLEDDNIINAFIAGLGATRDEAVADAVRSLEAITETLQGEPGSEG